MRILVTGGAGFIGSHVTDAVIAAGHEVAVLDNLSTGKRENVHAQVHLYEVDLRDADGVDRAIADFHPAVVNHHAAQIDVRKSTEDPVYDAQVNILGSLNLLRACRRFEVGKVVYASTGGAIYGEPARLPADESLPERPIAEYGVSKHTVEHYLQAAAATYGLNYTILRYANIYGPRQNVHGEAGVIAIFIGKMLAGEPPIIFGGGTAVRDYTYVGDVVRANLLALTLGDRTTVNIGTGEGTSVLTLYRMIAGETGYTAPPIYLPARAGEIEKTYLDPSLAATVLGWKPEVAIAEGIRLTVDYVRMH